VTEPTATTAAAAPPVPTPEVLARFGERAQDLALLTGMVVTAVALGGPADPRIHVEPLVADDGDYTNAALLTYGGLTYQLSVHPVQGSAPAEEERYTPAGWFRP